MLQHTQLHGAQYDTVHLPTTTVPTRRRRTTTNHDATHSWVQRHTSTTYNQHNTPRHTSALYAFYCYWFAYNTNSISSAPPRAHYIISLVSISGVVNNFFYIMSCILMTKSPFCKVAEERMRSSGCRWLVTEGYPASKSLQQLSLMECTFQLLFLHCRPFSGLRRTW